MPRRGRIQAVLGVAIVFLAGAGFVGSASWAKAPLGGSAPARPTDGLANVSQAPISQPVATPTPGPTPSVQQMMQSMQAMNRCSQMMAAGGMGGTTGTRPPG